MRYKIGDVTFLFIRLIWFQIICHVNSLCWQTKGKGKLIILQKHGVTQTEDFLVGIKFVIREIN
jgi:hypothetical protein